MATASPFATIPKTPGEWLQAARTARVENMTLFDFEEHRSGSKVTKEQFLSFRTFVTPMDTHQFDSASWGLSQNVAIATQMLSNSPDFQSFLGAIQNPQAQRTGAFRHIPPMLAQVPLRTDRGYPAKLQDTDEAPVNAAVIALLHQISEVAGGSAVLWRYPRVHFEAIFGDLPGGGTRGMEVITDGQLQSTTTHEVKVVVECKSAKISPQSNKVKMQEAALIMAWIKEFPTSPNRRVLVSQDGMQLFVTFAQTPKEWRKFLLENKTTGNTYSLMRLYRYGPWSLQEADHVREIAAILLAITW